MRVSAIFCDWQSSLTFVFWQIYQDEKFVVGCIQCKNVVQRLVLQPFDMFRVGFRSSSHFSLGYSRELVSQKTVWEVRGQFLLPKFCHLQNLSVYRKQGFSVTCHADSSNGMKSVAKNKIGTRGGNKLAYALGHCQLVWFE